MKRLLSIIILTHLNFINADENQRNTILDGYNPSLGFALDNYFIFNDDANFSDFQALGSRSVLAGMDFDGDGKKEILLADEISPDTCRLWDATTEKKLDKDIFRNNLGDLIQGYQDVARRLGILHEQSNISPIKFTKPIALKFKKNK